MAERPDACPLDVHMPGNGIQAAGDIAAQPPDAAIAQRLGMGRGTVRGHARSILKKLRVPDRYAAIKLIRGEKDETGEPPRR